MKPISAYKATTTTPKVTASAAIGHCSNVPPPAPAAGHDNSVSPFAATGHKAQQNHCVRNALHWPDFNEWQHCKQS